MIYIISLIAIVLLVGIDQAIKFWAAESLIGKGSVEFLKIGDTEILNLSYHENIGAAFSSFSGMRIFLIIFTSIFIIAGLYLIITKKIKKPALLWSVTLIIAGGIGNLIDRVFRSFVIDYFEVKLFRFAVFNFADCCIVIGAVLMVILFIFFDKSDKKEMKNDAKA